MRFVPSIGVIPYSPQLIQLGFRATPNRLYRSISIGRRLTEGPTRPPAGTYVFSFFSCISGTSADRSELLARTWPGSKHS
jgi:hypothetical protein